METTYTAQELIEILGMVPHEEGGWYAFVTKSGVSLPGGILPGIEGARDTCSVIYYLLRKGEIYRWHQLRCSEVWAWHMGGSLEMTLGGTGLTPQPEGTLHLGPRLREGERPQILACAGQWQTTRLVEGDFALVSCIVAPAFHEEDCLLPAQPLDNEIYG